MKKLFITGATGCVGHYIIEQLLGIPDTELHLLVRKPERLRVPKDQQTNIIFHVGNMEFIEKHADVIREMTHVIHIATDWSDSEYATLLNVEKTHFMFNAVDPEKCEKIVYFSTASILGPNNKAIPEAGKYGQGYVRSKYKAYMSLKECICYDRIITVFPTLVFGGDESHPGSHISDGIGPNRHYLKWLRFIYPEGALHFLHAKDIATTSLYFLFNEMPKNEYVLGMNKVTGKAVIETVCRIFGVRMLFRFKVTSAFIIKVASLLKITIGPWEKHCIENPYMVYDTVNPSTFGKPVAFPDLTTLLTDIKSRVI